MEVLFPPIWSSRTKAFQCVCMHRHICIHVCTHTEVYVHVVFYLHASGNGCQVLFLIKAVTIIASVSLHRYSRWNNLALCFIGHIHIQKGIIKTFRRRSVCCWLYSSFQGIWAGIVVMGVPDISLFIFSRLVMTFWMVPIPSPLRRPVNLEAFKHRSSLDLM